MLLGDGIRGLQRLEMGNPLPATPFLRMSPFLFGVSWGGHSFTETCLRCDAGFIACFGSCSWALMFLYSGRPLSKIGDPSAAKFFTGDFGEFLNLQLCPPWGQLGYLGVAGSRRRSYHCALRGMLYHHHFHGLVFMGARALLEPFRWCVYCFSGFVGYAQPYCCFVFSAWGR